MYCYFKLAYVTKLHLAIIVSDNGNNDKRLVTIYEKFSFEIFVYPRILLFMKFCAMKIWCYTVLEFEEGGHILHEAKNDFGGLPVSRLLLRSTIVLIFSQKL